MNCLLSINSIYVFVVFLLNFLTCVLFEQLIATTEERDNWFERMDNVAEHYKDLIEARNAHKIDVCLRKN